MNRKSSPGFKAVTLRCWAHFCPLGHSVHRSAEMCFSSSGGGYGQPTFYEKDDLRRHCAPFPMCNVRHLTVKFARHALSERKARSPASGPQRCLH